MIHLERVITIHTFQLLKAIAQARIIGLRALINTNDIIQSWEPNHQARNVLSSRVILPQRYSKETLIQASGREEYNCLIKLTLIEAGGKERTP